MKVEYSITGSVDIPPALLALMEASGKSPNEYVRELFLTADTLPAFLSEAQITVDGSESHAEPIAVRPATPVAQRRERVLSGLPSGAPRTPQKSADKPTATKPMGRPATLWDHKCSDGGPVRERGDRSIESLTAAGHEVYRLDGNGETVETFGLRERKPVKKSAAPVSKGYKNTARPVVVSRQRGK